MMTLRKFALVILLTTCTALSLILSYPAIAQEAPATQEAPEVIVTAEALATVEITAVPVPDAPVIVNIETGDATSPPAADTTGGWVGGILVAALGILGGMATVAYNAIKNRLNVLTESAAYLRTIFADESRLPALREGFIHLPSDAQEALRQLHKVAAPWQPFVPGDLDDEALDWLKRIVYEAEAAQAGQQINTP